MLQFVLESLTNTILGSLPVFAVWVWALIRARRLRPSATPWHRRIGPAMVALIGLSLALPIVHLGLINRLQPQGDRMRAFLFINFALRFLSSLAIASCWFVVLSAALAGSAKGRGKEPEVGGEDWEPLMDATRVG